MGRACVGRRGLAARARPRVDRAPRPFPGEASREQQRFVPPSATVCVWRLCSALGHASGARPRPQDGSTRTATLCATVGVAQDRWRSVSRGLRTENDRAWGKAFVTQVRLEEGWPRPQWQNAGALSQGAVLCFMGPPPGRSDPFWVGCCTRPLLGMENEEDLFQTQ